MSLHSVLLTISVLIFSPAAGIEADVSLLEKQLAVLKLTWRLSSPMNDPELVLIRSIFNPLESLDMFTNPETVQRYFESIQNGTYQPRGEPFNILKHSNQQQMIELFEIFHFAKDWNLFYNLALAARDIANEGQFFYALSVALLNRPEQILLPPIYEVFPQLYFPSALNSNVSQSTKADSAPQNTMSYILDDVGLNEQYTLWYMQWPFWWNNEKYGVQKPGKGEQFLHMHHQILNLLNANRLSNGLPEILPLDWDVLMLSENQFARRRTKREELGCGPTLRNLNFTLLYQFENKTRQNILAGVFQNNHTSNSFAEELTDFIQTLTETIDDTAQCRNQEYVRENSDEFELPILRNIDNLAKLHQDSYQPYSRDEVEDVIGVEIKNVEFDPLVIHLEEFDIDSLNVINETLNALPDVRNGARAQRLTRLTHDPFEVKITANSEVEQNVTGRIFLAPTQNGQRNVMPLEVQRWKFIILDKFFTTLLPGDNTISRKSSDFSETSPDSLSTQQIRKQVEDALAGLSEFQPPSTTRHGNIPNRLIIPMGTIEGFPLTLFTILNRPDEETPNSDIPGTREGLTRKSLGFPFDRRIPCEKKFSYPNIFFRDVTVQHKSTK